MRRAIWVVPLALAFVSCRHPIQRVGDRVDDRIGFLSKNDVAAFDRYLAEVEQESGIDVRLLFVDSVVGETLEQFAVRTARDLGIGQDLDRHGILFVYVLSDQRLHIEVGPTLQGVFPDRFIGYLMRGNAHSLFASANPSLGLRITLFMLDARLRRAALGDEYDPRAVQFIEDPRRLATGGGASAGMATAGAPSLVNRPATEAERRLFTPQPTVAEAYQRYLDWVAEGGAAVDVDLFTPATRGYLSRLPMAPIFHEYVLFMEYGRAYQILERGDLAMLFFTDDPLISPHFFRRTTAGWQMDIFAEVRDTHEYVGGPWTWSVIERDDDIDRVFRDRYVNFRGIIRIAGGDNRPIPIYAAEVGRQYTRPGAANVPGLERLTIAEAAQRVASAHGRPVAVLFYSIGNKATQRLFPAIVDLLHRCQEHGAVVLGFSVDEQWFVPPQLPGFLREHDAPFPAIHVYPWLQGQFTAALVPLGIHAGTQWQPPLIALLDAEGRVLAQEDGIVSRGPKLAVGGIEAALRRLP